MVKRPARSKATYWKLPASLQSTMAERDVFRAGSGPFAMTLLAVSGLLLLMPALGMAAADCGATGCGTGYCFLPDPNGPPQVRGHQLSEAIAVPVAFPGCLGNYYLSLTRFVQNKNTMCH